MTFCASDAVRILLRNCKWKPSHLWTAPVMEADSEHCLCKHAHSHPFSDRGSEHARVSPARCSGLDTAYIQAKKVRAFNTSRRALPISIHTRHQSPTRIIHTDGYSSVLNYRGSPRNTRSLPSECRAFQQQHAQGGRPHAPRGVRRGPMEGR